MKESLKGIDRNLVFRETFNSEQDVIRNGGVPVDVGFSEGIGSFNGTTSNIKKPAINIGREFSIRIKASLGSLTDAYLFSGGLNGAASYQDGFYLGISSASKPVFVSKIYIANFDTISVALNKYYEFTFVVSESENKLKFYLDGEFSSEIAYTSEFDKLLSDFTHLGAVLYSPVKYSSSNIELFEIYNKALTAEEVSNLYNNLTFKDVRNGLILDIDARQGVIEDKMGNALTNNGCEVKKSNINIVRFNGTDYITFPQINIGTEHTVFFYGKVTDPTTKNLVIGKYDAIGTDMLAFANGRIYYSATDAANRYVPYNYSHKQYFSAAIVRDGLNIKFYVNGIYQSPTHVASGLTDVFINGMGKQSIGNFFTGDLGALKVYNRALTAAEITQLYTSQKRNYNQ